LIGGKPKREREEEEANLDDIPADVWGIVMKFLNADDMRSLSVVDKQRLRGMRTRGVTQKFLWRINLESYRNIPGKPWMKYIQRVVVSSLETLEALKNIGLTLTEVHLQHPITEPLYPSLFQDTIVEKVVINYNRFNQPLAGLFPPSLKTLIIGFTKFNHPIEGLPDGLLHFKILGGLFNQPVIKLPPGLISITLLTSGFNQSIDNFPLSLKRIELGENFDQPFPYFPNLRYLEIHNEEMDHENFTVPKEIEFIYFAGATFNLR
jgi:hypothetical protein